jgi:3'(2'), 5'-bisphosphate nucleotidase
MRVKAEAAMDLLSNVCAIAERAGAAIMDVYARDFAVELKDDQSPLTAADLAAHTAIAEGLAKLEPLLPLLSEESGNNAFEARRDWDTYWLVDPLDGTKEFVKRNGEFTVNIALIDHHEPVLGVVYAPVLNRLYSGIRGVGAWLRADGASARSIAVTKPAHAPVRVVGSRSHASPELGAYLAEIGPHELKSMGSSLKICLVAEGEADVYPRLGPTSEWDTAAAHAVLLGAGGQMVDTSGQPLRYNKANLLNPHFIAFGDPTRRWLK